MLSRINPGVIASLSLVFALIIQVVFSVPQVPCHFIFGDSSVDNGNNNNLPVTLARGNFLPYGVDFVNGATGRFTNGRLAVDVLTQLLDFDDFIPPYTTASGNNILRGVNYGSAASGILDETGSVTLGVYTMNKQLQNHVRTIDRIKLLQNNNIFTDLYMKECLYTVSTGSSDYLSNYLLPLSTSSLLYTPERFAARLIQAYTKQLKTLYDLGARKVAIFGVGLLGCLPSQITLSGLISGSSCAESVNDIVQLFDNQLIPLVQRLNNELTDATFTFINTTSVSSGDRAALGITVENKPCCTVLGPTGICIANTVPCRNRNEYVFYDGVHFSETITKEIAARSYSASSLSDVYPVDISHLVKL